MDRTQVNAVEAAFSKIESELNKLGYSNIKFIVKDDNTPQVEVGTPSKSYMPSIDISTEVDDRNNEIIYYFNVSASFPVLHTGDLNNYDEFESITSEWAELGKVVTEIKDIEFSYSY